MYRQPDTIPRPALLVCCSAPQLQGTGAFVLFKRQLKDKVNLRAPLKYYFLLTLARLK